MERVYLAALMVFLIFIATVIIVHLLRKKKEEKEIIENYEDYIGFVSRSSIVTKLRNNRFVRNIGAINNESKSKWETLFNNAKNPWGITPAIFQFIRITCLFSGAILAIVFYSIFENKMMSLIGLFIAIVGWWYPMYYYKAIGKEREVEWDKVYEFVWLIKNTAMLYDGRKVCLEVKNYIEAHYPHYKEIISGFDDFYTYWEEGIVPDFIKKYYNFAIPKEVYNILLQMSITGEFPEISLNNLRVFTLNKHDGKVQKILSGVSSKATLSSLPFLMVSVVVAIMVPMLANFIKLM